MEIADIYELNPAQSGILFHCLKESQQNIYLEQFCFTVQDTIDPGKAEKAWNKVIDSNEILRSVVKWKKLKKPLLVVLKENKLLVAVRHTDYAETIQEALEKEFRQGLDIEREAIRITLYFSGQDTYMIMTSHHIFLDGWSSSIIMQEFEHFYKGQPVLKENTYNHYMQLLKQPREEKERFWRSRVSGIQTMSLPEKQAVETEQTNISYHQFSDHEVEQVANFIKGSSFTLSTIVYAAWTIFLGYYNGEQTVFGATVSGREYNNHVFTDVAGLLINTLPFIGDVCTDDSLEELCEKIWRTQMESLVENGSVPLEKITSFYHKASAESELFNTLVVVENYPVYRDIDNQIQAVYSVRENTHYDITLQVTHAKSIEIKLLSKKQAYDSSRLALIGKAFQFILFELIGNTKQKVDHVYTKVQSLLPAGTDITIASSFIGEPVEKTMVAQLAAWGKNSTVQFRPLKAYCIDQLRDLAAASRGGRTNIFILRMDDLADHGRNIEKQMDALSFIKRQLHHILLNTEWKNKTIFCIIPSDMQYVNNEQLHAALNHLENEIYSITKGHPAIYAINLSAYITNESAESIYNMQTMDQFNMPYTEQYYDKIGASLARVILSFYGHKFKVIVTDCDNTLWNGVCGEGDVQVDLASQETQKFLLAMKKKGFLLCIASKNEEEDVWKVFLQNQDMILQKDDFTAWHINWNPKYQSMLSFAEELNLAVDSFIFMDDNITECVEMLKKLPQIFTLFMPSAAEKRRALLHNIWAFDKLGIQEDDKYRGQYYKDENNRKSLRQFYNNDDSYLQSLQLKVDIHETLPVEGKRIIDLSMRVSQFTNQPGKMEFESGKSSGNYTWSIYLEDIVGSYGMIGGARFHIKQEKVLVVDRFFLSCRALDRNIEYFFLQSIMETFPHVPYITIPYTKTNRNAPFLSYLEQLQMLQDKYVPFSQIADMILERCSMITKTKCGEMSPREAETVYNEIAESTQNTVAKIDLPEVYLAALQGNCNEKYLLAVNYIQNIPVMHVRNGASDVCHIEDDIFAALQQMWVDIIGSGDFSQTDTFFMAGGTSIQAAILTGRINDRFGSRLLLSDILIHNTLESQSALIRKSINEVDSASAENAVRQLPDEVPLLAYQNGIYISHNHYPDSLVYNHPIVYCFKTPLDRERLDKAVTALINKYDILRLSIHVDGSEIVQRIQSNLPFTIQYYNWPEVGMQTIGKELVKLIEPFDLSQTPLFRMRIIEIDKAQTVLFFDIHHIIMDGISLQVLIEEFERYYNGGIAEQQGFPFRKYVLEKNDLIASPMHKKAFDYWDNQLADSELFTKLPYGSSTVQAKASIQAGLTVKSGLTSEEMQKIKEIALAHNTTVFSFFMAAFGVLISTVSRKDTVCIGTPLQMRDQIETERSVGFYINSLPIKVAVQSVPNFVSLLQQVSNTVADAIKHKNYCQGITSKNSDRQLYNIMLVYHDFGNRPLTLNGSTGEQVELKNGFSEFDLSLIVANHTEGVTLEIEYKSSVLEYAEARMLMNCYTTLIRQLCLNPHLCINDLTLCTNEEKNAMLSLSRGKKEKYKQLTLYDLFEQQCKKTPDNTALFFEKQCLTYFELYSLVQQYVERIRLQEDIRNRTVALLMGTSVEQVAVILAIWKCGGAYVPIHTGSPRLRVKELMKKSRASWLIADPIFQNQYEDILQIYIDQVKPVAITGARTPCAIDRNNLAYIIFTSGTTGEPKGVQISHASIANAIQWRKKYYRMSEKDRCIQLFNYAFDGFLTSVFTPLISGASLLLCSDDKIHNVEMLCSYIANNNITHFICVPTLYKEIIEFITEEQVPSLQTVVLAGEVVSTLLVEKSCSRLPRVNLCNEYGPTENSVVSSARQHLQPSQKISAGNAIDNTDIYVLSPSQQLLPQGFYGEIYLGGSGLSLGYIDEKNDDSFIETSCGRLYRTGDIGRWNFCNELEILGRYNRQVKWHGYRIDLEEIDQVINRIPKVIDVKTVFMEASEGAQLVTNYVGDITREKIIDTLGETLPAYMIPQLYRKLDYIPVTKSGKADEKSLHQMGFPSCTNQPILNGNTEFDKIVKNLQVAFYEIFQIENITIDSDFFALGGNSMKAVMLVETINNRHDYQLYTQDLYRDYIVGKLAMHIYMKLHVRVQFEGYNIPLLNAWSGSPMKRLWKETKIDYTSSGLDQQWEEISAIIQVTKQECLAILINLLVVLHQDKQLHPVYLYKFGKVHYFVLDTQLNKSIPDFVNSFIQSMRKSENVFDIKELSVLLESQMIRKKTVAMYYVSPMPEHVINETIYDIHIEVGNEEICCHYDDESYIHGGFVPSCDELVQITEILAKLLKGS